MYQSHKNYETRHFNLHIYIILDLSQLILVYTRSELKLLTDF